MKKLIFLVLAVFSIYGCNRDTMVNNNYPTVSSSGAYILSEGGFSSGSSKLSFYSSLTDSFYQSIFRPGNLGLFTDGLVLSNNTLYVCEQGNFGQQGKVYKLDTNGNVISSSNVGVNPFSLTISNGKLYLTNGPESNVTVVDKSDFSFIKNINVGVYPQEILSYNNFVFVCNTSMYGGSSDSSVSAINSVSDSVFKTIIVRKDPSSLCITDNSLIIGCPGDENNSMLYWVNLTTLEIIDSTKIATFGFSKDIYYNKLDNCLYFISFTNDLIKYDIGNKTPSLVVNNTNPNNIFYYGYAYDVTNKLHFLCDANNFMNPGKIKIYDENGNFLKEFTTGIAPRRVCIR